MKIISFVFRHSKRSVITAAVISAIAGISSAALLALINLKLGESGYSNRALVWAFVGLVLITLFANFISRFLLINISQGIAFKMRMRLCRQVLNVGLRQLEETGSHRVIGTLTQDIPVVANALLDFPVFCVNLSITIGCLAYLCWLSPAVFGAFCLTLAVSVGSLELMQKWAKRYLKLAREEWDELVDHFQSLTDGAKELKLHRNRREAFFSELLQPTAESFRQHNTTGRQLLAINATGSQILYFVFIGVLLFVLPAVWEIGRETLIAYTLTALFLRTPVTLVVDILPSFSNANISLSTIEKLGLSLASSKIRDYDLDRPAPQSAWGQLELDGVTHKYHHEHAGRNFTLGPINLTLRVGELVFLVGGNGSGKTSLAKLLAGLYVPDTGLIQLDGKPINDERRDRYRQLFSVVFSTPFLFERLLGMESLNLDERAQEYIAKLQLDKKVSVKDGVLSTTDLSQGQRKRLALLTAYLEDRPFYIFDEWAADQDPLFKEFFYMQLIPELQATGKTILVISHDDRYYHLANRIIKLEHGQIVHDDRLAYSQLPVTEMSASLR